MRVRARVRLRPHLRAHELRERRLVDDGVQPAQPAVELRALHRRLCMLRALGLEPLSEQTCRGGKGEGGERELWYSYVI